MEKKKLNKTTKSNLITYGMVLAAYLIVQGMIAGNLLSNLMQGLLVPLCVYIILALSLNLTVGILGELSLGHAGFMCVGAFSGALFSKCMKGAIDPTVSLVIAVIIGAAVAAVFGVLIGIPVLRLKGDYLAIVTLAFGEIIKNIINAVYLGRDGSGFHISLKDSMSLKMDADGEVLIKGAQGITGTPQAATFTIGVILVLITLFIVMNLVNSRTGRAIMAIRDNRIAAESIGINITKYKLMAFSISAGLAGVAGVLYAHNLTTIHDTIQYIKCDVSTICMGMAASMGAFLLASGTKGKRFALPNAEIMIHQPLIAGGQGGGLSGQATDIKIHADHIIRTRAKMNRLLSEYTGQPLEKVEQDTERDNFLSAQEAKEYGLIDEVITHR